MLGKGSFGYVYIVRHKATGCFFALKKLKKSSIKDIDQFINSIRGHFLLNHPNLVKLYTFFYDKEHIYLLLELCMDGNLARYKKHMKSDC
jgi:serine/threonine protein kinase